VTYFEQIGGEIPLRAIIDEFVERICADTMIGFLFQRVNRTRLKQMEYEHAAEFLGAPLRYSGRDLQSAHRRHPIASGHFGRRRQLLKSTLERHHVPPPVIAAWLAHQDALRGQVVRDEAACIDAREPHDPRRGPPPAREQNEDER
jgi:hemoglobin